MATIDVCMAAYNAGDFIVEAIESVLSQTFADFRLIIVDDGSADRSFEIASHYADRDDRVKAYRNDANRGVVFTRNRLLSLTEAPYVAIADADDVCRPERLQRQLEFLQRHPDIGVVASAVDFQGSIAGHPPSRSFYSEDSQIRFFLMFGPCIWNTTTMYRRELLVAAGGYREEFTSGASDYELWSRLATMTNFASMDEHFVLVNVHEASLTATRAKVDTNIFRTSATMLSRYLGIDVTAQQARDLHLLMVKGGLTAQPCSAALDLAERLLGVTKIRENNRTLRMLKSKLVEPIWTQAGYHSRSDRKLSVRLAAFAAPLDRWSAPTKFVKLFARLVAPTSLRRFVKKIHT
jgi:glycosyltransferase involved in cell wall biosynthesis